MWLLKCVMATDECRMAQQPPLRYVSAHLTTGLVLPSGLGHCCCTDVMAAAVEVCTPLLVIPRSYHSDGVVTSLFSCNIDSGTGTHDSADQARFQYTEAATVRNQ